MLAVGGQAQPPAGGYAGLGVGRGVLAWEFGSVSGARTMRVFSIGFLPWWRTFFRSID